MTTAYLVSTVVTIAANAGFGIADLVPTRYVLANSAEVGVPRSWLPMLGILKIAGAAGLVFGLLGVRPLGVAAAIGLILFFVGAIITHLRARVHYNIVVPGACLALAVVALIPLLTG